MSNSSGSNSNDIVLASLSTRAPRPGNKSQDDIGDQEVLGQSLPSCDGGKEAWRMLIAAFVFEALFWGFPLSFGVFQDYYSRLPQFASDPYISVVGTTASGISYLGAPIIIPLIKRYSRYRRWMIWFGWPLCILSLLAGSFTQTLSGLILLQGIAYGLGFVVFYYPILSMVNEFWVTRRGMAYGIMCASSGVSGAAFPFALEAMLNKYGYQTTLRAMSVGLVVLTAPLIPFIRGRIPESAASASASAIPKTDWSFLRVRLFWIYSISNLAQGLGYFFPAMYIPSYATAIGLSSVQGALLLATMSVSQVLGQLSFGYLSDRRVVPLNLLITTSTVVAAIAIFLCWGLARTFSVLLVFSLIYGYFGSGFTAMWARMGTAVSSDSTAAFASFGLFNFGKGMGNVLAGPISGALVRHTIEKQRYAADKYESVVLFAGSCMALSTMMISLHYLRPMKGGSVRTRP